jgi:hypothetical protein
MQDLEKSLNPSLGGLFLCLLAAMCFVSFSAVTVKCVFPSMEQSKVFP